MEAEGEIKPGAMAKKFSQQAYGAFFAEVAVDMDSGEVRLRRMLGVFAAGRILNAEDGAFAAAGRDDLGRGHGAARGGGRSTALRLLRQPRPRRVPRAGARGHPGDRGLLPARGGRQDQSAEDQGLGELGISGARAAVANAVFNACGVRVRDFPITLDKVLVAPFEAL
jgi:xanthine dehydrogenase YagR molybdenum-binding subunit